MPRSVHSIHPSHFAYYACRVLKDPIGHPPPQAPDRHVAPRHRYDLLAIDLDGTLLGSDHQVSRENLHAVRAAKQAGVQVCICTGRGYRECRHITEQLDQTDPVAVAGGAILAHGTSGRTLHRFPMAPDLVHDLVAVLVDHGHAALVLKDPTGTSACGVEPGHDYVVVSPKGESGIDPISKWWFDMLNIHFRVMPSIEHDDHPEHTVRVGVCGTRRETAAAAATIRERFADRVTLHHFGAIAPSLSDNPDDSIVILEAFDHSVNKWTAIDWLANHHAIPRERVAAIGNDVNDVVLLKRAGLGIAVANAIPECLAVADRTTLDHNSHGVAHAIERILSGEW